MRNPSGTDSTNADGFRRLEVITGVGRRRRWSDEDGDSSWEWMHSDFRSTCQ